MLSDNIYQIIKIDEQSITPKYLQLSNSVLKAIEHGRLEKDYLLPSINDLSYELEIARDTAEKAYRHLKQLGVIGSVPGKGYFIAKTDIKQAIKVFLIFNKLSAHKKIIYDSFAKALGQQAAIDFYIYNNDFGLFKKLLQSRKEDYTHYVIIPHFLEGGENAAEIINEITTGKLILLDKIIPGITREYGAVYENFQSFCNEYAFNYKVVPKIADEPIQEGEVYINLMEDDLVILLAKIQAENYKVGKNIGIISYNETPWKQFILDGITTISTDFNKMGVMAAEMVLRNDKKQTEVPFALTLRNSL
jgi:DNA-binding transcriptional regulator YhcF (GntR family)